MALRPHWLDDVFANPKKAQAEFVKDARFVKAFDAAQQAFDEVKASTESSQSPIYGPSPAQAARQAFLAVLELQPSGD